MQLFERKERDPHFAGVWAENVVVKPDHRRPSFPNPTVLPSLTRVAPCNRKDFLGDHCV
jgi:hypothetical protein